MVADVAQRERSKIKYYASVFSNILIDYIVKLDWENKILFGRFKPDPVLLQRNDVVFLLPNATTSSFPRSLRKGSVTLPEHYLESQKPKGEREREREREREKHWR